MNFSITNSSAVDKSHAQYSDFPSIHDFSSIRDIVTMAHTPIVTLFVATESTDQGLSPSEHYQAIKCERER